MTSDSANTVHRELIGRTVPLSAISNSSCRVTPRRFAIISRNLPVPAEHLSFIWKSCTMPPNTRMILVSCPPTSIMAHSSPAISRPPLAWQVISVITWSAKSTATRPYPVATTFESSDSTSTLSSSRRSLIVWQVSLLLHPVGSTKCISWSPFTTTLDAVDPISIPI